MRNVMVVLVVAMCGCGPVQRPQNIDEVTESYDLVGDVRLVRVEYQGHNRQVYDAFDTYVFHAETKNGVMRLRQVTKYARLVADEERAFVTYHNSYTYDPHHGEVMQIVMLHIPKAKIELLTSAGYSETVRE